HLEFVAIERSGAQRYPMARFGPSLCCGCACLLGLRRFPGTQPPKIYPHGSIRVCAVGIEGISPVESALAHGPFVFTKKNQHASFIRLKGEKSGKQNPPKGFHKYSSPEQEPMRMSNLRDAVGERINEQRDSPDHEANNEGQSYPAIGD